MGTQCPFHIWLRQSVPALVVYPPFDAPHMLTCRGTRHHRTQFLREPCQVVKQNLSLFIHDILHERFHPGLLRPVHISLREGSFGGWSCCFSSCRSYFFRTDCLLPCHKFTLHGLESRTNHFTISIFYFRKSQTIIGRRKNFGCPSVPSGQNSIFPMCVEERDDGISTLRSHQYSLADEGVTEEIKRQTFAKHCFAPCRHKVLMRGLLDQ